MVKGWLVGGDWLEETIAWRGVRGKVRNLKLEEKERYPSWFSLTDITSSTSLGRTPLEKRTNLPVRALPLLDVDFPPNTLYTLLCYRGWTYLSLSLG